MGVERRLKGSKPRGGGILLGAIIDADSRDYGNEEHKEKFQREKASFSRVSQFPLISRSAKMKFWRGRGRSMAWRRRGRSMASFILTLVYFLVDQNNTISMLGREQSSFMITGVESHIFANNTQGSIPNPTIRQANITS